MVPTHKAPPAGLLRAPVPCQAARRPRERPHCTGVPRLTPTAGLSRLGAWACVEDNARTPPGGPGLAAALCTALPHPSPPLSEPPELHSKAGGLSPAAPGLTRGSEGSCGSGRRVLREQLSRAPRGEPEPLAGVPRGSHGPQQSIQGASRPPGSQGRHQFSWWLTQAAVDAGTPGRRELEAVTPHFRGPPIN